MGGYNIGLGVGIKYDTPKKSRFGDQPIEDIFDAILTESGVPILTEKGDYFKLEESISNTINENESSDVNNDNYWSDALLI